MRQFVTIYLFFKWDFKKCIKGKDLLVNKGFLYSFERFGVENKTIVKCVEIIKSDVKYPSRLHS